jgi:two-component system OmpR family sensor kinase
MSRTTQGHSLKGRLLAFLLAAVLLVTLLLAATSYRGALREADAMFDHYLQQTANSLRGAAPLGIAPEAFDSGDGFELYIQIWGPDGVQLYRSARSALPPRAVLGFSDVRVEGNRYRVYSVQTRFQTVQIAQDMDAREARARAMAWRATWPLALMAPLLMLAVAWIIRRSLAPVQGMRRQVASRAADDLSPLDTQGLPDEVRPLVQELNLLFGRVQKAFDAQKSFVADAAHELRSPLTALKLQAHALGRADRTGDEATREAAVQRLNQGIDRAIALVEQMLVLARQEAQAGQGQPAQPVDLQALVREGVTAVLPQAQARGIDLGVLEGGSVVVPGHPDSLAVLLRNLLDNAIKYSPAQGQVDVGLDQQGRGASLVVEDSGPGIPEAERERVLDRFYRVPDAPARGSGLGLAIVKTIADQHGATLLLGASQRLGGLRVELWFPA